MHQINNIALILHTTPHTCGTYNGQYKSNVLFQYDIGTHIMFQGKQAVSQGEPLYYSALVLLTSEVKNYTSRFWG